SIYFFSMIPPPPTSTLFPYTTLFRSQPHTLQENSCLTTSNSESATMQRAKRSSSRHSNRSAYLLSRRGRRRTVSSLAQRVRLHRSEEHTSELQSLAYLVCRLLLEKKK